MEQIKLILPSGLVGKYSLSASETLVLGRVLFFSQVQKEDQEPKHFCYISSAVLSEETGFAADTIRRARYKLQKSGLLLFAYNKSQLFCGQPCWIPAVDLNHARQGLANLGISDEEAAAIIKKTAATQEETKAKAEKRAVSKEKAVDAAVETRRIANPSVQRKKKSAGPAAPAQTPDLPAPTKFSDLLRDTPSPFSLYTSGLSGKYFTREGLRSLNLNQHWQDMPEGEHTAKWNCDTKSVSLLTMVLGGTGPGEWLLGYSERVFSKYGRWDAAAYLKDNLGGGGSAAPVWCRFHFLTAVLPRFVELTAAAGATVEQIVADTAESYRAFYKGDIRSDIEELRKFDPAHPEK